MGGCRCNFRQCHVSYAKFPRMHFFRFPLKEPDRYKKWRQYSKMEHMLEFSEVRRKNTSICARHFRLECFMNYKMDRLAPNAVPTVMRLSMNQALDFELDIENGVLVTLESTKFEHLVPPNDFECPLSLTNDKILLKKLNELQRQQYSTTIDLTQHMDYVDADKSVECEELVMEETDRSLVNSVEILETIQVSEPRSKRPRKRYEQERVISSASVSKKKCKILNITNCAIRNQPINESTVVLASRSIQLESCGINNDKINLVETAEIKTTDEFVNNEEQLFMTNEVFINADSEDTEFFEVHNQENYKMPLNNSDTTIVKLKSDNHTDSTVKDASNQELIKMQNHVLELNKDFDTLQAKLSLLEAENNELKKASQVNEEMSGKLLSLQIENNAIKSTLKDYEILKEKLRNCYAENEKLRNEVGSVEIFKSELLSRKIESKELKKLLEELKCSQSKKEEFNLLIQNDHANSTSKITKLKEANDMKRKLELSQEQVKDRDRQLKELKTTINRMESENDRLSQDKRVLEHSITSIQKSIDIEKNDYRSLKTDFDNLQQKHATLEQKYWKLQALQNQESTVSTSMKNSSNSQNSTITKAQLFNGIKRYLSASMVSLLRMDMFGSSDREWKNDERQVAVNILSLGETVYKYFTDEWRIRLPALRDVHNWLSQSQQVMDYEEDL